MSKFSKLSIFAIVLAIAVGFAFSISPVQGRPRGNSGGSTIDQPTSTELSTPLLVVTVRAQGSNRFGVLYWSGATPNVSFNVFRNGQRIATVSGSTTGNNLYTDSVRSLRGTFQYQVCYAGKDICSNSITVVYDSSTETIRYAPVCPTTGTAKCIVTLE